MKKTILSTIFLVAVLQLSAQSTVNPVIKSFGGIYDIPEATMKVDTSLAYRIVIDVYTGSDSPSEINPSLNNVARLLNLHAVAGADMAKMEVVLAIHGTSAFSIMDDEQHTKKYGLPNPNNALINELADAGVKLTVCGQSLKARKIPMEGVNPNVAIATSMLTTVTTYQLKGFAYLKF